MDIPGSSPEEIKPAVAAEAYATIAELPDDEAIRETIKLYSDQHLLTTKANVCTLAVDGLPSAIVNAWVKAGITEVSSDDTAHQDPSSTIHDLVKENAENVILPAYQLWVTAGMNISQDLEPTMLMKIEEPHSGLTVFLRRNGNKAEEDFELSDGYGKNIGLIDEHAVTALLESLANVQIDGLSSLSVADQHKTLLYYIGEHYGRRRSEFRLTAFLGEATLRNEADEYAGVLLIEDETPSGSTLSFVLEHLLDHKDLGTKVVHRMAARYFGETIIENENETDIHEPDSKASNRVIMHKIIASDNDYTLQQMSTATEMIGRKRELTLGPPEVLMLHNILEQVIGSVANRFIPEEISPKLPTEEQL